MATCGNCKTEGQTVSHIRECYSATRGTTLTATVAAPAYVEPVRVTTPISEIPASRYALDTENGLKFYGVRIGKAGSRWDGFRFVDLLVGHPGDFEKYPVKGAARTVVLEALAKDPREAAVRFSKEFTVCAVCGSPLTDPESRALGLGPTCAERF